MLYQHAPGFCCASGFPFSSQTVARHFGPAVKETSAGEAPSPLQGCRAPCGHAWEAASSRKRAGPEDLQQPCHQHCRHGI
ncbi:hypothetical protein AAFF_G00285450 [Aldrovandia affinis]|uniref:Uncharacterized protein n=1 Tax=Aldrovandia affinis TaxID=143900 RepID=A0AAD7TBK9_9TELE|nr:hypothetical protein AAFF_G00285450 [Aldrovandia affinis]